MIEKYDDVKLELPALGANEFVDRVFFFQIKNLLIKIIVTPFIEGQWRCNSF